MTSYPNIYDLLCSIMSHPFPLDCLLDCLFVCFLFVSGGGWNFSLVANVTEIPSYILPPFQNEFSKFNFLAFFSHLWKSKIFALAFTFSLNFVGFWSILEMLIQIPQTGPLSGIIFPTPSIFYTDI